MTSKLINVKLALRDVKIVHTVHIITQCGAMLVIRIMT
jgi:hypothetical protein